MNAVWAGHQRDGVLIVEDDEASAALVERQVSRAGWKVEVAGTCAEAYRRLETRRYSAIVVDYRLPDGDGIAVMAACKAKTPFVPVVLMTGVGDERIAAAAVAHGAAAYIIKYGDWAQQVPLAIAAAVRLGEANRANAQLAAIVEYSADAILSTTAEGLIATWNPAATRLFGYAAGEIIGVTLAALVHPSMREEGAGAFERVLAGGSLAHAEYVALHKDGSSTPVLVTAAPIRDERGRATGVSIVAHDLRTVMEKEAAIRRLNAELEIRVAERTAELSNANAELEAFTGSASHDLRAPLRRIDAFCAALVEDCGPEMSRTARDYLERIRSAIALMYALIDNLLDLSRAARDPVKYAAVDLSDMAEAILLEFAAADAWRHVRSNVAPGILVNGDPGLLRIALANVLSNAWKFTASRAVGRIDLSSVASPEGPLICIADNGVGFDLALAEDIFRPFKRLHGTSEFPGTGIGLATVDRIVRRHGGKVWAEATPEEGAKFFLRLPDPPVRST